MSATMETAKSRRVRPTQRVFGIPLGVNPVFIILVLLMLAGGVYWWNSRDDESDTRSASARPQAGITSQAAAPVSAPPAAEPRVANPRRRERSRSDSGTLRLRAIDATRGDVDPMLRLDLLERLQSVKAAPVSRNIFETGTISPVEAGPMPVRTIMPGPKPVPVVTTPQYPPIVQPVANIPFRYYGFAKPYNPGEPNRGFFLQGDNVVMATEGQLVQQRYRIVQLTATTAKVEDTQVQLSQTLNVLPEAVEQQ